jgi:hypothetical protein
MLPSATMHDSVTTLRELMVKLELIVRNFVVLYESSSLITKELL